MEIDLSYAGAITHTDSTVKSSWKEVKSIIHAWLSHANN